MSFERELGPGSLQPSVAFDVPNYAIMVITDQGLSGEMSVSPCLELSNHGGGVR